MREQRKALKVIREMVLGCSESMFIELVFIRGLSFVWLVQYILYTSKVLVFVKTNKKVI